MNQIVSGLIKSCQAHTKPVHDRIVSVIAQPPGITDGYQKQIQRRCSMGTLFDMAVMDQAVIQPTELFGDLSDPLGENGLFGYHGVLLCSLMIGL